MSEHNKWYGKEGIDTPYERSIIGYRPNLVYPDRESSFPMNKDIIMKISRSQDFLISRAIMDYQTMIDRIQELLTIIKNRQDTSVFQSYLNVLEERKLEEVFQIEDRYSGYDGSLDFEIYTMLYYMMCSLKERVIYLNDHYRTQVTNETDIERAIDQENNSINNWIKVEYDLLEAYSNFVHDDENQDQLQKEIDELEQKRTELDQFHTSLADTSYIHRNRYMIFDSVITNAEMLVNNPQKLIDGNVPLLMNKLLSMKNIGALKAHLMLSFKEMKLKHNSIKQQYMMIDENKETFASERNYMYQQIMTEANNDLKNWLYEQPEDSGKSLDLFADLMVNSVKKTKKSYEESLADMLNYYQNEGAFYGRQISAIQKKEEIRLFYRIINDLEDTGDVSEEWILEYARSKGYDVYAT